MGEARKITYSALLIALGVLLPIFFHRAGIAGRIFLPMHIPVLMAGLIVGPLSGLAVGVLSPIISTVITGMPRLPYLLPMVPELAVYGLVGGAFRQRLGINVWISLVSAMVAGRAVWVISVLSLLPVFGLSGRSFSVALVALAAGWPGLVIQLILIPPVVRRLEQTVGFGRIKVTR